MKKTIPGLFAIGIALALSAFTYTRPQTDWMFALTNGADPKWPQNYYKVLSQSCGPGNNYVCYVIAPETSINGISRPDLYATRTQDGVTMIISAWIDRALHSDQSNNFVQLKN